MSKEVLHERCCGLDIHKRTVAACLLTPGQGGQPRREVRSFSTMTRGLLELSDCLGTRGNYFDQRDQKRVEQRLVHRLQGLGYQVILQPAA